MLEVIGFTTVQSAHRHLLKHLWRLAGLDRDALESARDPERWDDVIGEPILIKDLSLRRRRATEGLAPVRGCAAGQAVPTAGVPCTGCQDRGALRVVSTTMHELMTEYLRAAEASLRHAFSSRDRQGRRILAYQSPSGPVVEAVDQHHVVAIGSLDGHRVALYTCYRDLSRSLQSRSLEVARRRSAHRRAGTLVELEEEVTRAGS